MQHTVLNRVPFWSLFASGALLSGALAGCSDTQSEAEGAAARVPAPPEGVVLREFIARVRPSRRSITIEQRGREAAGAPGLSPESLSDLDIVQDGVPGSGPANTVDLVTNSIGFDQECPAGFQSNTWCANVTLEQFFSRSIRNTFVQITSVTDVNGVPLPDHGAVGGDASQLGLGNALGLWQYTTPKATTPGVLGRSPDNAGTRDWIFANPDNADTLISIRVVASLAYSGYNLVPSSSPFLFLDACAGPGAIKFPGKSSAPTPVQTLPFPFTLYNQTFTTIQGLRRGVVTFGSSAVNVGPVSVNLPVSSPTIPAPGLFVFWDSIDYMASGAICMQATSDPAPNRRFIITWTGMDFGPNGGADNPAALNFSAVLSEGSDQIDLLYGSMTGKSARATGSKATVGVQNATATLATAIFHNSQFSSSAAFSLLPLP
jgi:hypothetical protein